jgi:outer membrane protein OmpA-like peptidoglycan-associated protein
MALVPLSAACGGDPAPPTKADGTSVPAPAQPSPTGPEPTSCPGGGQLIKAVEIPAVHTAPVRIPEATIGGQKVPAVTVPGLDIPAQRIPAQCVEVKPAPGGCLGALAIPATAIPGVRIPEVHIPGVQAGGLNLPPVTRPAVSRPPMRRQAVTRNEVCQSKPSQDGQYVDSVVRDGLARDGLARDAIVRDRACNDKGECIPAVRVPAVSVPGAASPSVSVPTKVLKGYRAGKSRVFEGEDQIAYNIEADVLFDFGRADIKPAAAAELAKIAASIAKEVPSGAAVQVDGHTDAKGDPASNQRLSEQRAQAIVDWLAAKGGIARTRLKGTGYGETKPVAANTKPDGTDDPRGRTENRRVVISAMQR